MLTCPKCKQEQSELEAITTNIPLFQGGYHLTARCYKCNAFIKNLPHSEGSDKLYFGKYKGKFISEIAKTDKRYLEWLLTTNLKESLKFKIQQEIEKANGRNAQSGFNLS